MKEAISFGIFGFVSAILGPWIGAVKEQEDWQRELIERGYAIHCPNDGQWAWKGECDG